MQQYVYAPLRTQQTKCLQADGERPIRILNDSQATKRLFFVQTLPPPVGEDSAESYNLWGSQGSKPFPLQSIPSPTSKSEDQDQRNPFAISAHKVGIHDTKIILASQTDNRESFKESIKGVASTYIQFARAK